MDKLKSSRDSSIRTFNFVIYSKNPNFFTFHTLQLYQFSKMDYVSRQKVIVNTQLPPDEVKEILLTVAKLDPSKNKWHLLQTPDTQFEKNNQELKQRQDVYWRAKELKFQEMEMDQKSQSKRSRKRSIREGKSDATKWCNDIHSVTDSAIKPVGLRETEWLVVFLNWQQT